GLERWPQRAYEPSMGWRRHQSDTNARAGVGRLATRHHPGTIDPGDRCPPRGDADDPDRLCGRGRPRAQPAGREYAFDPALSKRSCRSISPPGAHAIRQAFMEVGRAHERLYPRESHSLPDFVPYAGESDGDSLALQLFDEAHQRVAGTGI